MILFRLALALVSLLLLGGALVALIVRRRRRGRSLWAPPRSFGVDHAVGSDVDGMTYFERRALELPATRESHVPPGPVAPLPSSAHREAAKRLLDEAMPQPDAPPPAHPFDWPVVWALGAWRALKTWEENPDVQTRVVEAREPHGLSHGWVNEHDERVRAEAIRVARTPRKCLLADLQEAVTPAPVRHDGHFSLNLPATGDLLVADMADSFRWCPVMAVGDPVTTYYQHGGEGTPIVWLELTRYGDGRPPEVRCPGGVTFRGQAAHDAAREVLVQGGGAEEALRAASAAARGLA